MSSSFSSTDKRAMLLMAYADGELEGKELEEAKALLAKEGKNVRFANEIAGLGDLLKTGHAKTKDAKAIASFDIADAIMAKLPEQTKDAPAPAEEAAPVSSFDLKREPAKHVVQPISLAEARARRLKIGAAVGAALALAASIMLFTREKEEQPMALAPVAHTAPTPSPNSNSNSPAPAPSADGVDVNVVEAPGHSVSVFHIPNETSMTTSVVVWVDEPGGK